MEYYRHWKPSNALLLSRYANPWQSHWCYQDSNAVFGQLPKYLQNCSQRVQNSAAGYVTGRYAKLSDVINLNWLPIHESIGYNTVKCVYHSLHDRNCPSYLRLETVEQIQTTKEINLTSVKSIHFRANVLSSVNCH